MPRISHAEHADRKKLILELIRNHPEGIKTAEIADMLQMSERTVRDYLTKLEETYYITADGWYWMPLGRQTPVKLSPTRREAVVLYLALRMFVKQSDRRNPLAERLLYKLAQCTNEELHLGEDLEQAAAEMAQQPEDREHQQIFEQVMLAYMHRHQLRIVYHPYRSEPFETVISPYLIEPSGFGFGTYVIGHSSISNALRTYKLERILSAEYMRETFIVPHDFPGLEILRDAWSIFHGDATEHIVLRFAPEVARRVRESNWRGANPKLFDDPEQPGYVRYEFDIADTTDLKPWIRTWGANVEVLAPQFLRDEMMGEARELAHLYGWTTETNHKTSHSRFSDIFGD
ncbi:MAG: helix-turn-helix transcriptional regulator [Aggregatilineales bacterium]